MNGEGTDKSKGHEKKKEAKAIEIKKGKQAMPPDIFLQNPDKHHVITFRVGLINHAALTCGV